ncbi:hypothetical protein GCM10023082_51920 [Streptomyces tremellae]|uniref:Acid phosphatase n=1 Tax=Streptomyces tremellae TaxID=1124239 RepID=A0ABP7FYQ4_9ACTN
MNTPQADRTPPQGTAGGPASPPGAAEARGARARDAGAAPAAPSPAGATVGWSAAADAGAPTVLVLLRHGETALTPEKRFSGSGGDDPCLSAAGRRQAAAAAAELAARAGIQDVVSSPLGRCVETAGAVAARTGLDVHVEHDLREADFGAWEGLTFAEARERHPADLAAWQSSPWAPPTGGESFGALGERVEAALAALLARYAGRTVLVVTHVTPVKTLVRRALGAPPEALFRMELSPASTSAIAYYPDGSASLRVFNDTSYLR